ncbi:MAG TPA: squalene synthase HpnC [Calditrichia bacterium]|nr:squalene synthase HpnC [Calditrichota bacterium]HQU71488.1 squalene synthase HpnC [Calditrichia bacterium]HQV32374.1 squalene synthase HpnC [Calditrichia bacterium]
MHHPELSEAYQHCKALTTAHYENFPVASVLLPRRVRHHIYPIYAFARHADDLADESADLNALRNWRTALHACLNQPSENPIFLALANTIRECQLPVSLFDDLLDAFERDLHQNRYADLADLESYCRCSANPVGRLILLLHGYQDEQRFVFSDHICTALQWTNFWQDVKVDIAKNRIYIPQNLLRRYQVEESEFSGRTISGDFRLMMQVLVARTREKFRLGTPLLKGLSLRLRWELALTIRGGLAILDKIEALDFNVLAERPKLGKKDWLKIIAGPIPT